jgi:UDP-N-acetylmuramate--alanine ligase
MIIYQLEKGSKVHFIGIGGISMSALAVILKNDGYSVRGSDFKLSSMTEELESKGISVAIGHNAENISGVGLVVYTAAISSDNPELVRARELGITTIERATLLGALMKRYKNPIAVSGTHGKTTTTSMLSHVLLEANVDPTILVGGVLPAIGSNMRDGAKDYLVMEACEYSGSFLKFFPRYSIILNIEEDHLDYFKDINDIVCCFKNFVDLVPEDGKIIANFDDEEVRIATENAAAEVASYGIKSADAAFRAENISFDDMGYGSFNVVYNNEFFAEIKLSVPGMHNVSNSLAVIACAHLLGINCEDIKKGLASFTGTNRRFEKKGTVNGAFIIDDYAHHPTEIRATLSAARAAAKNGEVWCVFQPHTYTRAYKLKDEFAKSFSDCEHVILSDIYAAREKDTGLIHSIDLAEAVAEESNNAIYIKGFDAIAKYLRQNVKEGDIVLTMGAGDIFKIGEMLAE